MILRKGFKQIVNPSYGDVFTGKSNDPDMLVGKSIADQIKNSEEIR